MSPTNAAKRHFSNPVWIRCHRLLENAPHALRGRRRELVEQIKQRIEREPDCKLTDEHLRAIDILFRQVFQ